MVLNIEKVLVLDIETVRGEQEFEGLDERLKIQWERKARFLKNEEVKTTEELYLDRAGIYAEFGQIITIACGFFVREEGAMHFRVTSITNNDEQVLLAEFSELLSRFNQSSLILCGHNAKEFDFPYLCRRLLVNNLPLPEVLDIAGKKPWEINHLDTMELWKFGDYKHYTSLELLASIFNIPSSKADIDGSQVSDVFYHDHDLEKIALYCQRDVVVTAQLLLRLNQLPAMDENHIHYIENDIKP